MPFDGPGEALTKVLTVARQFRRASKRAMESLHHAVWLRLGWVGVLGPEEANPLGVQSLSQDICGNDQNVRLARRTSPEPKGYSGVPWHTDEGDTARIPIRGLFLSPSMLISMP